MANPADQLHLLLEVAAPGADLLAEPLDDDRGGVLQHGPVRCPERALAEDLGGGAEQQPAEPALAIGQKGRRLGPSKLRGPILYIILSTCRHPKNKRAATIRKQPSPRRRLRSLH
jgi:hypothetical protein